MYMYYVYISGRVVFKKTKITLSYAPDFTDKKKMPVLHYLQLAVWSTPFDMTLATGS